MLLSSASPAIHPSAARSRRQDTTRVSLRLVEAGLLQRRPCRPSGFNVGAVPESAACRSSFGAQSPATQPRVCGFEGAALAPSRTTNRLQAVLVSPQVIAWSSAGVHHQGSCGRPVTLRAAVSGNYVVPRTNRRLGERAFSVTAAKVRNTFPTFLVSTCQTTADVRFRLPVLTLGIHYLISYEL